MAAPDVVVVDHHDSYTWNLVHLIAFVTGVLPLVVQHDEVAAADLLAGPHYRGIQFHAESILTENGFALLHGLVRDLLV